MRSVRLADVVREIGRRGLYAVFQWLMLLFQTLLSELQSLSAAADVDNSFTDVIISCCHVLVMSSTLGLSLTTKFDHMVCVLIVCYLDCLKCF